MRPEPLAQHDTGHLFVLVAVVAAVVIGVLVLALTLTGGPDPLSASRSAADRDCAETDAERPPRVRDMRLRARTIARLREPVAAAFRPDGSGDGVIGERAGRVVRVIDGKVTEQVVIDLRDDTLSEGDGGLLALAYDPAEPWLYLYRTDADREDEITAHALDADGVPVDAEPVVLLHLDRPHSLQHHGGGLVFGSDGALYVGVGDGGGIGDPRERAQDRRTLLGKVLRIHPTPRSTQPYEVPADNPFVGQPGSAPEIWAVGVRNPFRLTLDAATGDLWLADVGQSCWEELTRLAPGDAGANLGWDRFEGFEPYEGGEVTGGHHAPTYAYSHESGRCAVVAGPVVRGPALPDLDGWLLFADFCDGRVLALDTAATPAGPLAIDVGLRLERPALLLDGPNGLPWALGLEGDVYELEAR